jgi:cell division protein FtsN
MNRFLRLSALALLVLVATTWHISAQSRSGPSDQAAPAEAAAEEPDGEQPDTDESSGEGDDEEGAFANPPSEIAPSANGSADERANAEGESLPQLEEAELRAAVAELESGELSSEGYSAAFDRALSMVDNVRVEQQLRLRYATELPESRRLAAFTAVAETAELLGNFERAVEYYTKAIESVSGEGEARLRHAQAELLLELGRADEAELLAERVLSSMVPVELQRSAALLLARTRSARGDHSAALELLSGLSATRPLAEVEPKVLLALHEVASRAGETERAQEARDLLAEAYPESPERLLAEDTGKGTLSFYPTPSRLLSGTGLTSADVSLGREPAQNRSDQSSEPEESRRSGPDRAGQAQTDPDSEDSDRSGNADRQEPNQPEQSGATGVQTGSFTNRDNAESMVRQLGEQGFDAEVTEVTLSGTTYYRVVVAAGADQSATDLQFRLKTEGYDGLLMFDERDG